MLGEIFDPKSEPAIYEHFRPHWAQAGAVVFITFRTRDSIPREVIRRWDREKQDWLVRHGYGDKGRWSEVVPTLEKDERALFRKEFNRSREEFLDTCHGRYLFPTPRVGANRRRLIVTLRRPALSHG